MIKKPFARKIQILTVGEQRAKVMKKRAVVNIFKKGNDTLRKQKNVLVNHKGRFVHGQDRNGEPNQVNLVHKGVKQLANVIYLKKQLRLFLPSEYAKTTAEKRKATRRGKQVSKQPKAIARKTKKFRSFS